MEFSLSSKLKLQLNKIKQRNPKLYQKIQKQLKLFLSDHKHPSLRLHKIKSVEPQRWSISITDDQRMLFYLRPAKAIFYTIGTHDQVYREKK